MRSTAKDGVTHRGLQWPLFGSSSCLLFIISMMSLVLKKFIVLRGIDENSIVFYIDLRFIVWELEAKLFHCFGLWQLGNILGLNWKLLIVVILLLGRGCVNATCTDSESSAWDWAVWRLDRRRFRFFNLSSLMGKGSSFRLSLGWLLIEPEFPTQ